MQPARAVRRTGDGRADLACKVMSLVDGYVVSGAAEGYRGGETAYTAADDGDV